MSEEGNLEDKVTVIACAAISGAACLYGGFMQGWSRARGISLEYEDLMTYGPILLSASMFGVKGGIEAYSQALTGLKSENRFLFAGKVAAASAVMGGFLGGYNQLCFGVIGYIAGMIVPAP